MSVGIYLNNNNGKRVIGSDTEVPRFIGKYTKSALDTTSNYGDYMIFSVTCPGKPLPHLYTPIGAPAGIRRIVQTGPEAYDIYVFVPYYFTANGFSLSDIQLYLFSGDNTVASTSGMGMQSFKADGTVAYDSGFKHQKVKVYGGQQRNKWIIVGANEAANNPVSVLYNTSRGNAVAVVANIPYGDVYEVYYFTGSGIESWAVGDTLASSPGGATIATITQAVRDSGSLLQFAPIGGGATWSSLGIQKPAMFANANALGMMNYYRFVYQPNYYTTYLKFWHYFYSSVVWPASDGFIWGAMAAKQDTGFTTQDELDATAAMVIGNYGFTTHSLIDNCVSCGGCTAVQMYNDWYGSTPQVTWQYADSAIVAQVIDGADYD